MSDNVVARRVGVLLVIGPVVVWVLAAFGVGPTIPGDHFSTIIWAGVSLILGFDIRNALASGGKSLQGGGGDDES